MSRGQLKGSAEISAERSACRILIARHARALINNAGNPREEQQVSTESQHDNTEGSLQDLLGENEYRKAKLLDAEQVADLLSVNERSVYELRIPRISLSRRRVRWSLEDVLAFLDDRRQAA